MLPVISEWNFEAIVRIAKRDILNQSDRKSAGVRTSTLLIRIRFHRKVAIFRRNRATWVDTWLWIKNHRSWLEIENTGLHSYVTFLNRSLVRNAMSQRKGRRRGQLNQNARSVLTSAYHDTIFHFLFFHCRGGKQIMSLTICIKNMSLVCICKLRYDLYQSNNCSP